MWLMGLQIITGACNDDHTNGGGEWVPEQAEDDTDNNDYRNQDDNDEDEDQNEDDTDNNDNEYEEQREDSSDNINSSTDEDYEQSNTDEYQEKDEPESYNQGRRQVPNWRGRRLRSFGDGKTLWYQLDPGTNSFFDSDEEKFFLRDSRFASLLKPYGPPGTATE